MASVLRCIAGPFDGRELALEVEAPLSLPIRTKGADSGSVVISAAGGGWQLRNESSAVVLVNAEPAEVIFLEDGDHIRIGKMVFLVDLDDAEPLADVQARKGDTVVLRVPSPSAADQDDVTHTALPLLPDDESVESPSGGRRKRRKISASRPSGVQESTGPEKQSNLISKVTQVLRRGGRRTDLQSLKAERDELLMQAGRKALENVGGFGLPVDFLKRVTQGETVEVTLEGMSRGDLDEFRARRKHLAQLDMELDALRKELGIQASDKEGARGYRHQANEGRAFDAMDGVGTEELESD